MKMKYKLGDSVVIKPKYHWRKRKGENEFSPVGIILNTYEGSEPSYCVLIGCQKDWKYEEDLNPTLASILY